MRTGTALLVALATSACGEATEVGGDPSGRPVHPVRLLGEDEPEARTLLLEDDLSALDEWWILDRETQELRPASDEPGVTMADGVVVVAATVDGVDSPTAASASERALVRLVEIPAGASPSVTVRVAPGPSFDTSAPCDRVHFPMVQDPEHGERRDDILARGTVRNPAGRWTPLGKRVALQLESALDSPRAEWIAPPDASGLARARLELPEAEQRQVRALVLVAPRGPLRLGPLRVERRPRLDRDRGGHGAEVPIPADAVAVMPVRIGGDRRLALTVPTRTTHDLAAPAPPGTTHLSVGVCLSPDAPPGSEARWWIEVSRAGSERLLLAAGLVESNTFWPLGARFEEQVLEWPEAALADAAATAAGSADGDSTTTNGASAPADDTRLHFRVEGDAPVVFGQPLLRGPPPRPRPNLLLVSLDTLRADHLGCYGYDRPTSPAIDAFATDAAVFLRASSVGPYTLPTHTTMLTGLHPLRHGVTDGGADRIDGRALPFLPVLLSRSGYLTAAFTGGGFVSADYGFAAGFDRFVSVDPILVHGAAEPADAPSSPRRRDVDAVAQWIEDRRDEPWFVFLHTYGPHNYQAPEADLALFDTLPDATWGRTQDELQHFLSHKGWPHTAPTPEQVEHIVNVYDATVRFTDRQLGRLLERLAASGALDDTVVVITSDHGEEMYEHESLRHSHSLYEEMLSVPLIVRAPGVAPRRIGEPVTIADVTPTVLELLGLPVPEGLDGRSLVRLMRGERPELKTPLLVGHVDTNVSRRMSLRVGPWKIIRGDTSAELRYPAHAPWELYDLSADPGEQRDLSAERPDDLANLQRSLEELETGLRAGAVQGAEADVSQEILEQLRELGYF